MEPSKLIALCVILIVMPILGACAWELIKIHVSEKKERLAEEARRKEKEIQKNQNELIKQIGIIFDERLQIVKEAIAFLLEKDSNQSGSNNTDEGYTDIDNGKTSS